MRISDWSSDVCSSDLERHPDHHGGGFLPQGRPASQRQAAEDRLRAPGTGAARRFPGQPVRAALRLNRGGEPPHPRRRFTDKSSDGFEGWRMARAVAQAQSETNAAEKIRSLAALAAAEQGCA